MSDQDNLDALQQLPADESAAEQGLCTYTCLFTGDNQTKAE